MSSLPDSNPYATPGAPLMGSSRAPGEFYVVSPRKLLILFFATSGLYAVYWFWRNWKQLRDARNLEIWPIPRGFFSIFFAHALNREIDEALGRARVSHTWSPSSVASIYVTFTVIGNIADRVASRLVVSPYLDLVSIACLIPIGYSLVQAQAAANAASADLEGAGNHSLTLANWAWVALGAVLWLLVLAAFLLPDEIAQTE